METIYLIQPWRFICTMAYKHHFRQQVKNCTLKCTYHYAQVFIIPEDYQKAEEVLVHSQHTITWGPAFVLGVINKPPEFDLQILWSNQIWHAIFNALFTKDILMQIKLKWGDVKYPLLKITQFCRLFPPHCPQHPLVTLIETFILENKNQRGP